MGIVSAPVSPEWAEYMRKNRAAREQYARWPIATFHLADDRTCACGATTWSKRGVCRKCQAKENQ